MGVPTSEVGYTPAMPRRVDHEVHKGMWWHWGKRKEKKKNFLVTFIIGWRGDKGNGQK